MLRENVPEFVVCFFRDKSKPPAYGRPLFARGMNLLCMKHILRSPGGTAHSQESV